MTYKKRLLTALALALLCAAAVATSASALTSEQFAPGAHVEQPAEQAAPTQVTVERASSNGFDWGDAGIGAGAAFAITVIGVGAGLALTNRSGRAQRQTTTA